MTTPEAASKVLRKPFPTDEIGKLPKISCTQCTKAPNKVCDRHGGKKAKCKECGAFITTAHVHLDYVGHAGVTNRLLDADPAWTWEPVSWDSEGAPLVQHGKNESVMWVRLTVGGVTRYGVGSAPLGSFELHKQLVSDAIRNASMRFGVALALWAKEPLPEAIEQDEPLPQVSGGGDAGTVPPAGVASPGQSAPDPEAPATTVEPATLPGGEVGTAPPGGTAPVGGENVTGGGQVPPTATPSGDTPVTLKEQDNKRYQSLNRFCRAVAGGWDEDVRAPRWEALAYQVSGGRTTHLGELTAEEAQQFRARIEDGAKGRAHWIESDNPAHLGWTLEAGT
jgi:hypothetical protein